MRSWTILVLAALTACTPEDPADTAEPSEPQAWDGWTASWESCSLYEGEDDGLAECSATAMPLFWEDPSDDRSIEVWAKRLPAQGQAERQLWLLDGGPGASGLWDFPARMAYLQDRDPALEIYTIDHRGTGYTERLGCDAELAVSPSGDSISSSEYPGCIEQIQEELGDRLEAYTTTLSSYDLAAYVEATRIPGVPVFTWGGSYGSYWNQRYLAVAPDQADGAIIEGIAPADTTLVLSELYTNLAAEDLYGRCAEDALCSDKLGGDPWAMLGDVLDRMDDEGHCTASGLSSSLVSAIFAYLMYSRAGMGLIPPATYRLDRCSEEDEDAIVSLYYALFGDGGSWDIASYSILLQHHVMFSEMWAHPDLEGVDLADWYDELYEEALVVKGYGHAKLEIQEQWPTYEDASWDDVWPDTDIPVLMLQGELDPVTPYELALAVPEHLDGPDHHWVSFEHSAHSATFDSPVSEDGSEDACGLQIVEGFLADPLATPDSSCVDRTLPVDFDLDPAYAEAYFGTSELWD